MNCKDKKNTIYKYIDGLLSCDDEKAFLDHINNCPSCKKDYENTLKMINDLKSYSHSIPDTDIDFNKIINTSKMSSEDNNMKKKKSFFNKNFIKKSLSYAAVFFVGVFLCAAFANNIFSGISCNEDAISRSGNNSSVFQSNEIAHDIKDKEYGVANKENSDNGLAIDFEMSPDKIIYNSSMSVEVKDYDDARNNIFKIVNDNNAFIQNEDKSISNIGGNEYYTSYFTIRVPCANFADTNKHLEELGRVKHSSSNAINVTYEYNDVSLSTEQLKIQKSRLQQLYNKADKISELIQIENELARINTLIEQNENIIKNYDRQIQYSVIQISISEDVSKNSLVNPFTNIGQKIKSALINSINLFLKIMAAVFVFLFKILPFVLLAAVIYFIVKLILKNKKNNIDIMKEDPKKDDSSNK